MFAHAQLELPDLNLKLLVTPAVAHQLEYLDNSSSPIYLCIDCHAHIASHEAILSRTFQGRYGLAYLVSEVVNVSSAHHSNRTLSTGQYIIAVVTCKLCGNTLGWKYLSAAKESQNYKEGCYLIEKAKVIKETLQWNPLI